MLLVLFMKAILISQVDSVSVLKLCTHIDLSTSHDQHGPVWQTVFNMSLANARNLILILTMHVMFAIPIVFYIYRTKIIVLEFVTVLYQISRHSIQNFTCATVLHDLQLYMHNSFETLHTSDIAMNVVYIYKLNFSGVYYHLVILFYSVSLTFICFSLHVPLILPNQSPPYWDALLVRALSFESRYVQTQLVRKKIVALPKIAF